MREDWPIRALDELLVVQNGYAFDSKNFRPDAGMPLIRIRDLKTGTSTETSFIGTYDKKYEVNTGDLLIGMDGEFACHKWRGPSALLNQRVCRLQDFSGTLDHMFLFYGINRYLTEIEQVTGFTTVKHLSSRTIRAIRFPLAPLPEQRRIVAILEEAFAGIASAVAATEQNLANAHELFDSHLNAVFSEKAEGWNETRLGDVCMTGAGGTPLKSRREYYEGGTVPWLLSGEVAPGQIFESKSFITETGLKNSSAKLFPPNTVLVAMYGATAGEVGILRFNASTNQAVCGIYPTRKLLPEFIYYSFLYRKSDLIATATGNAQPNISQKKIRDMIISVPPLAEQSQMVGLLTEMVNQTSRLERINRRKLDSLAELKRSILQKAFAGELTAEPDKALAEAGL